MNKSDKVLLVTPWHKPMESLLGYVLRVSERNGYDSPWHVMSHAGIPQGKMDSAGFPFAQFAEIIGRIPDDLAPISYVRTNDEGIREFQILGQPLGGTLSSTPLRLNKPQLCPHCIREQGYIDAFFDLNLAVACPVHGQTLIGTCHECGESISWFRPGLLTCKCGADITKAHAGNVSAELTELMSIMMAKVHGKTLSDIDNPCNFPLEHLAPIPLRLFLDKMSELGEYNLSSLGRTESDSLSILQAAAEVLQHWPNEYHAFIRRHQAPGEDTHRLSTQYEKLFASLLERHKRIPGVDFLREELVSFAMKEWDGGVVDWRLAKGRTTERRLVSNSEMAARIGVDWRTLRKWGTQGIIPMRTAKAGSQKRYVIDTKVATTLRRADGRSLGEREAAAFVGLPVSVLQSLRRSGHFEVQFLPTPLKAFHELDLNAFSEKVLALGEKLDHPPANSTSLQDVMRLKFRNAEGKADFVRAALSKVVSTIGRTGKSVQSLLFQADQVESFLRDSRAEADSNTWSISEAAKFLHCDSSVLPTLIEEKLIDAVDLADRIRVTEESVRAFDSLYVALARLAKESGTSSRKLQSSLAAQNIPMKMVRRGYGKAEQPFILRNQIGYLTNTTNR